MIVKEFALNMKRISIISRNNELFCYIINEHICIFIENISIILVDLKDKKSLKMTKIL